jgi:IS5 family transposase
LIKKNGAAELNGRCDSFVVETDVHYPTDIHLLYDALRKIITLSARMSQRYGLKGWGQSGYNLRQVKRLWRRVQKLKRSTSPDAHKQAHRDQQIRTAHQQYVSIHSGLMSRVNCAPIWSTAFSPTVFSDCAARTATKVYT